ncbi:MAG: hypothetical protein A2428_16300 [Bdellovibrionales bacterium RIFOXYC1_FULL_54_43]|nr:MAG: hypothetical protein A2428_16300 [Bdellovibrionales bacterium RIFOXYC1_FULL_54_43]OFZ83972.1 MAG: hypothetical protein A2603_10495 [Bdellovibrionales bacterium RIFOXYD1_FULL_55_31]
MTSDDRKKMEEFLNGLFLESFPVAGRPVVASFFRKHIFELQQILKVARTKSTPRPKFLDIGCGVGVNACVLSQVFGFEVFVADRLDEFAPELKREVGDADGVIRRWEQFGVKGIRQNFIQDGFPKEWQGTFDIVTTFDVIEHFTFSPLPFLRSSRELLNSGGTLMVGTPNQVHLYNRLKSLVGKNTWEDFQYFIDCDTFYGHVREFTPRELREMILRTKLDNIDVAFSSYPIADRQAALASKIGKLPATLASSALNALFSLNPNWHYYMIGFGTRK